MFIIFMAFPTKEVKHFPMCLIVVCVRASVRVGACLCLGVGCLCHLLISWPLFPVLFFCFCFFNFHYTFVYSVFRHQKSYDGMEAIFCHKMSGKVSLVQCDFDTRRLSRVTLQQQMCSVMMLKSFPFRSQLCTLRTCQTIQKPGKPKY